MLSAREYSALAGVSERHARRLAESGKLDAIAVINSRKRREYAFPLATQSNEIQLKYYEQRGLTLSAPEKTALQKVKPSPVQRPLDSYTDADREKIGFWQDVVDQWMLYRSQTGKPLSELDHKFVQHMRVENPGMELSVPTLYRKKKALDEGDLDSVIDRRGKARKGKTDMPEYIKKTFLHYYLVDGGEGHAYSIAKCMEYTEKWAEKNAVNALPLPSYSSFYRIAMDVPEAVRILMREGERAYYNKASVYTRRDYESIASNDWWVGDTYVKVTRKEVANVLGQLAAADVDGRVYPIKDVYRRTMDYVFREVSSGTKTPEEAVRRATLRLWQRGIRTVDRSDGRTFSVEFMAQRAIMAKMGEMTTAINEKHHDDGGCDGWEISAHSASAPDHEPYQGRQYSDKEYKRLNSRLQRRIGTLSCKHIAWPIKLGVDSPQWTDEQLAEMARENAKGITYEGRHYTQYEATQQQKALENSIRQCKDRIAAAQEEGKLGSGELRSSRILLRQLNAEYKRFSAAAGLRTAPERLRAAGLGRALRPDGTLEMPRPAGTLTGSGGKLDVEEARKSYSAYLDTLTDAPEKNMVWLRYFTEKNPTEYMEDGTLDAPFAYDPVEDRILYNPRHPQFSTTDFEMANTHELAHRTDVLNAQGYKNKVFVDAISDASKAVLDNAEGFQRVAQAVRSDLMKDILSALSSGRLDTGFGHKAEYWAKNSEAVPLEIFAELFTMETRNDSDLFFVKKLFPGLWKEYQKLF